MAKFMVWCRAGFRGDYLSVYTDLFPSHKRSKTTKTRMHYTMCYQLGVLACQWFEFIFQFCNSVFSVFKRFSFLSVGKVSVGRQTSSMAGFRFSVGFCVLPFCLAMWVCLLKIFCDNSHSSSIFFI